MTKKTYFKAALDVLMLIGLVLMYRKQVISLRFHEIGGLAVLAGIVLHFLLNGRWVLRVGAKLGSPRVTAAARISWVVDLLLLVSAAAIGVTGLMISRALLHVQGGGGMPGQLHYFFSALAIVLMGVHLGLHRRFIGHMLRHWLPLPQRTHRVLSVLIMAGLVLYGAYSLAVTPFSAWLTGPFRAAAQTEHAGTGEHAPSDDSKTEHRSSQASDTNLSTQVSRSAARRRPFGQVGSIRRSANLGSVLLVALQYLSEMAVFAALTELITFLFRRRRPRSAP